MIEGRAKEILQTLQTIFGMPKLFTSDRDTFETLITTIISQNTAGRNAVEAFRNLSKRFTIEPEALAKAETSQIEESLKVAGLHRNKAKTIKQVSRIVTERFNGNLASVLSLPLEESRKRLMQLPGVGPKTADVVLLFCAGKPTIPVDTHVERVAKRLGLAQENADYETLRRSLQSLFDPKDYLAVHVLLISLGRSFCRARNPLCKQCPVNALCHFKQLRNENSQST
jgi:endonuclease-3